MKYLASSLSKVLLCTVFAELWVPAQAAATEWIRDADGDYSDPANWGPNPPKPPPNGGTAVALFGSAITTNRTVSLDQSATLARIEFDNANNYSIIAADPSDTLILKSIVVTNNNGNGAHSITAPIIPTSDEPQMW